MINRLKVYATIVVAALFGLASGTASAQSTTTSLTASPSTGLYSRTVTWVATVTGAGSVPAGTVTFKAGTTTLGAANFSSGNTATFASNALAVGTYTMTAAYSGDGTYSASTSSGVTQTIQKHPTTASLATSQSSGSDTYSCFNLPNYNNGQCFASCAAMATSLQQTFGGQARVCYGSTPGPMIVCLADQTGCTKVSYTTTPASTSTASYGTLTLTATVRGEGSPSGTVTFKDGSATLGTATLSSGVAIWSGSALGVSAHTLSAVYGGDSNNEASTSATVTQVVSKAASSVALSSSASSSTAGQSVTLTAVVTASSPSGSVTFKDGATVLGSASVASGTAVLATDRISAGTRSLTAVYGGDSVNDNSTSSAVSQTVAQATSTTSVTANPASATVGQNVTLRAQVSGFTPTGTVTFTVGGTPLGTASVSGGVASLALTNFAQGTHSITAAYAGDANNTSSTSSAASLAVGTRPAMTWQYGYDAMGRPNTVVDGNAQATYTYYDSLGRPIQVQGPANTGSSNPTVTQFTYGHVGGLTANMDPNYSDMVLLLHADGANNSTTITDSSGLARTVTARGGAKLSTAQSKFGTASVVLNGSTDDVLISDTSAARFGTGEWTIEGWVRYSGPTSSGTYNTFFFVGDSSNAAILRLAGNGYGDALQLLENTPGSAPFVNDSGNTKTTFQNTQKHVVFQRKGSNYQVYVDGTLRLTMAANVNLTSAATMLGSGNGNHYFQGNIDEVRITKGVARYSGNFTVPTAPYPSDPPPTGSAAQYTQSVVDPRALTTTFVIDGRSNTKSEASPDRGSLQNTFDASGNMLTSTDARSKQTTYTYDSLNRPTSISYPTGTGTTFEYDGGSSPTAAVKGELTKMTDASGQTVYTYDALGRMTGKTVTIGSKSFTVGYTWGDSGSAMDKLTAITYPSGSRANYSYDSAGSVSGITVSPVNANGSGVGTAQTLLNGVTYNVDGAPTGWQWLGGKARSIGYDSNGLIASYTLGDPTGSSTAAGLLRSVSRDAGGRITGYTHTNNGSAQASFDQGFAYDNLDRLVSATIGGATTAYTYDDNGNRTAKTVGSTTYSNTIATTSNRMTQAQDASGTASLTYDAAGHMTGDGTNTFTYNDRGRMTSVTTPGGTVTYTYNGLNQRASKSGPTGIVASGAGYFVYDEAGQLLGEYDANGAPVYETIYFGSTPVGALKQTGTAANNDIAVAIYNVYSDHIDTPRVITKQDHTVVWRWDGAEAFGATAPNQNPSSLGTFTFNQRFPGQVFDAETGLLQNWNREYNAQIGRYAQSDPIGLEGGVNPYAYVSGNPVSYIDPTGKIAFLPLIPWAVAGAGTAWAAWMTTPSGQQAVQDMASSMSRWMESRSRGKNDPVVLPPVNPGRDCDGKCNPCPTGARWFVPKPGHGHENGYWHEIRYNQDPRTCMCYPDRPSRGLEGM